MAHQARAGGLIAVALLSVTLKTTDPSLAPLAVSVQLQLGSSRVRASAAQVTRYLTASSVTVRAADPANLPFGAVCCLSFRSLSFGAC